MSTTFRFVHTADLHLDSPLKSLARRDPDLATQVTNASRTALIRIIDLCIHEKVHALLIAGDIYDGRNPSVATVGFFHQQLDRLQPHSISVFLIRGNHDHEAGLSNVLDLPKHVIEFLGKKNYSFIDEHNVTIHGVSFRKDHATESALREFSTPVDSHRNIALLHTSLGGSAGHDIYAPCSVNDLDTMGFDYWALGHIHKHKIEGQHGNIVMPGIPQGRDMGEHGDKSVCLVTMDHLGHCNIEQRYVSPVRFERLALNVTDLYRDSEHNADNKLRILTRQFTNLANTHKNNNPNIDHWIFRLELIGDKDILYSLRTEAEHTAESFDYAANAIGDVYIEKITFQLIDREINSTIPESNLLAQLRAVIEEHLDDAQSAQRAADEFDDLVKLLPQKHLRDQLQGTPELRAKNIRNLQLNGMNELLSLVQSNRSED